MSTVNPCGFAMLPAYLAYFVGVEGQDTDRGRAEAVLRALLVGAVVSAGFFTVFGAAGVLLGAGIEALREVVPWLAMVVGVGVIVLGAAQLRGFELSARLPKVARVADGRRLRNFYVFGLSYAVASLSCVLPVFLVVVTVSLARGGFVSGAVTSLVYGVGMSLLLMVVTLAVALGRRSMLGWLRRMSRHVTRISGAILVLAGGYIVFFWVRVLATGGLTDSAVIRRFEEFQSRLVNAIGARSLAVGGVLTAILVVAAVYVAWSRSRRGRHDVRRGAEAGSG